MHPKDKKKYSKPRLNEIEPGRLFQKGWNRAQLLQARGLVTEALGLIEKDDELRDAAAKLRSILSEIDTELARNEVPSK